MPTSLKEFFPEVFALHRSNQSTTTDSVAARQLLSVYDDILFAWTDMGLMAFIGAKLNPDKNDILFARSTILHLTKIPFGSVLRLQINYSGTHICLMCSNYGYVAEIPPILRLFKNLNDIEAEYLCRCYSVEGSDYCGKSTPYLQSRWLPNPSKSFCFVTLRSDIILRIYNLEKSECSLVQSIACCSENLDTLCSTKLSTLHSIGDTAVSFDIAPCPNLPCSFYTIFILYGNGDVYSVVVDSFGTTRYPLNGPLTMSPASEDNYGVDSCDILALSSSKSPDALTCLVVATTFGNLYHCVVQYEGPSDRERGSDTLFSLHVYENVELESSLTAVQSDVGEWKEKTFDSPIQLYNGEFSNDTYHCVHNSGIHSVRLQWLADLERFNKDFDEVDQEEQSTFDIPCTVRYRLCTNLGHENRSSHVNGVVILLHLPIDQAMIVLLPDYSLTVIALSNEVETLPPSRCYKQTARSASNVSSFMDEIRSMLQQSTSTPLIKCQKQSTSEVEFIELLLRTVDVLSAEHVNPLTKAQALCSDRCALIYQTCSKVKNEAEKIKNMLKQLTGKRHNLSNRVECARNDTSKLSERIERLHSRLSERLDALSSAEQNMSKDLAFMQDQTQLLSEKLNRVNESLKIKCAKPPVDYRDRALRGREEFNRLLDNQNRQIETLMAELNVV